MRRTGLLKTVKKTINSTILCIRFPFLYPRNRFTGNHYDNWKIVEFHRKWWRLTEDDFFIHTTTNKKEPIISYGEIDKKLYCMRVRNDQVEICDQHWRVLASIPLSDMGKGKVIRCGWKEKKTPILIVEEGWEENTEKAHFIKVIHAKWLQRWIKFLDWINDYPLQLFHCIPKFTELDAMDKGWRKTFGIQICKEIKSALLKHGRKALYKYRIMQIKEKWGELCWYDHYSTEEIFNIIRKYEDISRHTCIDCGAPATKMSTGWICPYCDNCIGDREYTEIK